MNHELPRPPNRSVKGDLPFYRLHHDGLTVEGYARAVVQSYWRVPELDIGFDLGAVPASFAETSHWFISHCHLDHIAALPVLVAHRRRLRLPPPHVYLPACCLTDARSLLKAYEALDGRRMDCELAGLSAGDGVELPGNHVVTAFATHHTVPSLGFIVWRRYIERKAEFDDLDESDLSDLGIADGEATRESHLPRLCYTGDTAPEGLDANPAVFEAQILITELTFVDPRHRPDLVHKHGHLHLDDFVARQDQFRNELIIVAHLTARSSAMQVRRAVERRLPAKLRERLHVWV